MTETGEEGEHRRKIRLKESNAKCRHIKKFTCKGTLRQVFICLCKISGMSQRVIHYARRFLNVFYPLWKKYPEFLAVLSTVKENS
jgi:hypothetical protein